MTIKVNLEDNSYVEFETLDDAMYYAEDHFEDEDETIEPVSIEVNGQTKDILSWEDALGEFSSALAIRDHDSGSFAGPETEKVIAEECIAFYGEELIGYSSIEEYEAA